MSKYESQPAAAIVNAGRRLARLSMILAAGAAISVAAVAAQAADFSGDTIKVGVLTDMTGVAAENGGKGSVVAAQIAIDEFGGKIGDTAIEMMPADLQNKPDVGLSIAKKWVDVDHVDVIVDISNSALGLGVQELGRTAKIPILFSESLTAKITGEKCSPMGIQWSFNSYSLANMVARAAVREGAKTWFFITTDFEYGYALERDATAAIKAEGGEVLGGIKVPFNIQDASSYLLQAKASGADMIGIATPGFDTITLLKQAEEYQIRERGQSLAGLGMSFREVMSAGLDLTQGVLVGEAYYWDVNDETRKFAAEFNKRFGTMPSEYQASVYSSVRQYLTAVKAVGTDNGETVMAKIRELPVKDSFTQNGYIREDGQHVHDMYLFRVKKPEDSKGEWDVYEPVRTIPGDEAFQTIEQGGCPLVKK